MTLLLYFTAHKDNENCAIRRSEYSGLPHLESTCTGHEHGIGHNERGCHDQSASCLTHKSHDQKRNHQDHAANSAHINLEGPWSAIASWLSTIRQSRMLWIHSLFQMFTRRQRPREPSRSRFRGVCCQTVAVCMVCGVGHARPRTLRHREAVADMLTSIVQGRCFRKGQVRASSSLRYGIIQRYFYVVGPCHIVSLLHILQFIVYSYSYT